MPTIITGSALSITTKFRLDTSPKKFQVIDNTDYAGNGIPTTNVFGCLKIVSPSGTTIYNNTTFTGVGCDIRVDVSITQQTTVALPSLSNGFPEAGEYNITYTVSIDDGSNPVYQVNQTFTYTYTYTAPTVSITADVDCYAPLITGEDTTNYVVSNITPVNSRTFVFQNPTGSGGTDITNTTSATIVTGTFYTGQNSFTVTSELTYTFDDDLVVVDTLTGTKSVIVDCNLVCETFCCINSINTQLDNYKGTNDVLYQRTLGTFTLICAKLVLLQEAVHCGKQDTANSLMTDIKTLANCTDTCSCTDGAPRLVQGLGPQNVNVIVASGGAPVTVTSSTVGGITTYTVSLSSSFVNTVNNSYNTIVAAGSNVSVVDSGIISGVRTFTVSATVPTAQNRLEFNVLLEYANFAVPVVTITDKDYLFSGSNIIGTANVVATDIANPNWATMNNLFTVDTFQTATNDNFKVTADVFVLGFDLSAVGGSGVWTAAQMKGLYDMLRIQVLDQGAGTFKFRLVMGAGSGSVGVPLTNKFMVAFPSILISIKISE